MNFIYMAMIYLLNTFHTFTHSYGLAIVMLTVLIRVILWPLNTSQMRSMRKMQELQPKLKALQAKLKDQPQKMQEAMMKFYAEHKFNPLAGCLPLLIQLPIFIGLYGAVNNPMFLVTTVHEQFLFIKNLSHTLQTHAGQPLDGRFDVKPDDTFSSANTVTLVLNNGQNQEQGVTDTRQLITVTPKPILPGQPVHMTLDLSKLGLSPDYNKLVKAVDVLVVDNKSRELENVRFNNQDGTLSAAVDTVPGQTRLNLDVLALILLYGVLTVLYQRIMTPAKPAQGDAPVDPNAQMMRFMPLLFVVMLFFIPIPAGVMIYLVVTTALMFLQTAWVNWREGKNTPTQKPSEQVVDIQPE